MMNGRASILTAMLRWFCAGALVAFANLRAEDLLLTGATLHPMTGSSFRGQLLIRGESIAALGTDLGAGGARVISLDGWHVYPGLIAPSTALGLVEIAGVRATRDNTEVGEFTPEVEAWVAVNPDSELIPVARANGVTHALVVPGASRMSGQSVLIALSGWTIEDMTRRKQVGLHLFWPRMDLDTRPKADAPSPAKWKSLEEQAKDRQARLAEIEEFFAEARAYGMARNVTNSALALTRIPAWESLLPVLRGERPLMIHADTVRQIRSAVTWAASNELRMVLVGAREAAPLAKWLAERQVPVIFEDMFTLPALDHLAHDAYFRTPAVLAQAGVKIALSEGGRFEATSVRNLPYVAAHAHAFGLPKEEALRAITLYPAQMFGADRQLGSLEPGKEASLFAADGDILDIRFQVRRLWIAGKEVSLETRHTRLYEKYRSRPHPPQKPVQETRGNTPGQGATDISGSGR